MRILGLCNCSLTIFVVTETVNEIFIKTKFKELQVTVIKISILLTKYCLKIRRYFVSALCAQIKSLSQLFLFPSAQNNLLVSIAQPWYSVFFLIPMCLDASKYSTLKSGIIVVVFFSSVY